MNTPNPVRMLRRFLAAAAVALPATVLSAPTVDYTDLWFIPAESGWGANVIQQHDILFVTLFVYGTNGQPTWFVASSTVRTG